MKRLFQLVFCLFLVPLALGADDYWEVLRDLKHNGGIARFELTVKDDQGVPVEDAEGSASFYSPSKGLEGNQDHSSSDANGHLVLSERSYYNGRYVVQKEGYYATEGYAVLQPPEEKAGAFERRRWVPVVEEVTLKRKINPIPMVAWRVRLSMPKLDVPIGLDLEQMQWTPPYGEGQHADVWLTFNSVEKSHGQLTWRAVVSMHVEFRNPMDGIQRCKSDTFSELKSSYRVDTTKPFSGTFTLDNVHTHAGYRLFPVDEYLVFRVRSEVSPEGEIERCHYGKICSNIEANSENVMFYAVYFNPAENDTNLEFDPKRNLAKPDRRNKRECAWEP